MSYSLLTNEFKCEDTMRHRPLDVILLCRCVVIPCQQVHLQPEAKHTNYVQLSLCLAISCNTLLPEHAWARSPLLLKHVKITIL